MQIKVFRKRSFLNFSWLLLGRIYSMAIGILLNVLMVRYLGPERNGVYMGI